MYDLACNDVGVPNMVRYNVSEDGTCGVVLPKRRDGGGAYRAALRMQLEGKKFGSKEASIEAFREAVRQYKQW